MPRTIRPVGSVPLLAEAAPTSSAKAVNNATGRSLIRRTVLPAPNCGPTPFYGVASRYFRRMELGFALSSEDHPPNELVRQAQIAERAGFTFGLISDHFHPWVSEQGHSPFVWSTLGGIAQATESIRMGTGVTCPLIRIHPAIFEEAGGRGKPKIGMIHVAYDEDEDAALERAHKLWPNLALAGSGGQELPAPRDFEESAANVTVADVAESTPAGPDPEPYLELIGKYGEAGFTHVYVHQIGDNQDEFADFAGRELLPRV